jgi:hypothetical protein
VGTFIPSDPSTLADHFESQKLRTVKQLQVWGEESVTGIEGEYRVAGVAVPAHW